MIELKSLLIYLGVIIAVVFYSMAIYTAAYQAGYCQGQLDSITVSYNIDTTKIQ